MNGKKDVYIPSLVELKEMDTILINGEVDYKSCNLYCYIKSKAIEKTLMNIICNYMERVNIKMIDKWQELLILNNIFKLCPGILLDSGYKSDSYDLFKYFINHHSERAVDGLDYVGCFNYKIKRTYLIDIIEKLNNILDSNPCYRFGYRSNDVFDMIFNGTILNSDYGNVFGKKENLLSLASLEPCYLVKTDLDEDNEKKALYLRNALNAYCKRYYVSSDDGYGYHEGSLLDNPCSHTKKLIKYLKVK